MDNLQKPKKKGPFPFYAVFNGREIGIFTNWGKTNESVNHFHKSSYKGYHDLRLAVLDLAAVGIIDPHFYGKCPSDIQSTKLSDMEFILDTNKIRSLTPTAQIDNAVPIQNQHVSPIVNRPNISESLSDINLEILLNTSSPSVTTLTKPQVQGSQSFHELNDRQTPSTQHNDLQYRAPIISNSPVIDPEVVFNNQPELLQTEKSDSPHDMTLNQSQTNLKCPELEIESSTFTSSVDNKLSIEQNLLHKILANQEKILKQHEITQVHHSKAMCDLRNQIFSIESKNESTLLHIQEMKETIDRLIKNEEKLHSELFESNQQKTLSENLLSKTKNEMSELLKDNMIIQEQLSIKVAENKQLQSRLQESENVIAENKSLKHELLSSIENFKTSKVRESEFQNEISKLQNEVSYWQEKSSHTTEIRHGGNKSLASFCKTEGRNLLPKHEECEYNQGSLDLTTDKMNEANVSRSSSTSSFNDTKLAEYLGGMKKQSMHSSPHEKSLQKNSLKVSSKCTHLLMGDSNMKNVVRRRLDKSGCTEVRTYRGATTKVLTEIIKKCPVLYPNVEKVSICIGTNDCSRRSLDGQKLLDDVEQLIDATKKIFMSASICIISIPPQRNPSVNEYIFRINRLLRKRVEAKDAVFRHCNSLWHHIGNNGEVDKGILYDEVHLTEYALGLLLQQVTYFFYGPPARRHNIHQASNESRVKGVTYPFDDTDGNSKNYNDLPYQLDPQFNRPQQDSISNSSSKYNKGDKTRPEFSQILSKVKSTFAGLLKHYTDK